MGPKAINAKRAFGKSVDGWQWAWWSERMVLLGRWAEAAVDIQRHKSGIWFWCVDGRSHQQSKNFFAAVDEALDQLNLPWPVKTELRTIAAAEYERLCSMREEFKKLRDRG